MSTEVWTTIEHFIGNVGFPAFIALWLLIRSDRLTRDLTEAVRNLKGSIDGCRYRGPNG